MGHGKKGSGSTTKSQTVRGLVRGGEDAASARTVGKAGGAAFPIVGVGASAGGLEAFSQLLGHLPTDSGMAFVLIQHLDPTHKSFLKEALGKATSMPISQVEHNQIVQPNHVYVIPADADVSIDSGHLELVKRADEPVRSHLPIDGFFVSLAAERGPQAIGVVLSGTAADGSEGLRAIKAEGGITLAQDPRTAKFAGMPQNAIEAGVVDYVLSISSLATELVRLSRHPYLASSDPLARRLPPDGDEPADDAEWESGISRRAPDETTLEIMNIVKIQTGVDFTEYKSPTFNRRLARRMALRRIEGRENYLAFLKEHPEEVGALCEDALIHVSSFFRDPEVYEILKLRIFPEILKHKVDGAPIRIWVAGCSTGEEVYSIGLTLLDFLGDSPNPHPIQIFGSDVSEPAIRTARAGRYADGAMTAISESQRRRYFTKIETGYRINKSVRDLCVYVRHDLAHDPPFSKVDLLSCRNVLIYFDQALQRRLVPTFHYSLNRPGFLLLGRTENITGFGQLFFPIDKEAKIFGRSTVSSNLRFAPRLDLQTEPTRVRVEEEPSAPPPGSDVGRHLDSLLLARYAPPGVLVNERMEILQFRGQTGSYLQPAPGEPQNNIVKMARGGLLSTLRATLARAKVEKSPVRTPGVEVEQDGVVKTCDLVVLPFAGLPNVKEQLFVVLFEDGTLPATRSRRKSATKRPRALTAKDARRIPMLEHELSATREYLHSLMNEHSRTSDDLGSVNEELISGNEELQSLNEELETAKEELQSTNEELTTVNDELNNRNQEVSQINTDLVNLLDTVDIPIVILDKQRHIRRFTPQARTVLNLLPSDVGRRFDDIKPNIDVRDLDRQVAEVIKTFIPRESDVQDHAGRWYRMQIRPYRRLDRDIDGAIISLFDIDALKHHLNEAHEAKEEAERADRAKDEFLAVLSHELRTPLSALLMQTQLLRQGGLSGAKHDAACDAIERSTKMQAKLVDDLLDVSRIVTGKMRVDLQPADLVAIVKTSVDSVAALVARKSIDLNLSLDESLGKVSGDRLRLQQVVCNLLINAIKFTPSGGRVEVLLESIDGLVHLEVSDTGMGIEPAFLPRIFNRLTQKDSSTTRTHDGLGLGLAIVRHLVDAHGGTVRAESPGPGRGAAFHVTLPLLAVRPLSLPDPAGPTTSGAWPPDAGPHRLDGRRILVLEDDEGIRHALAEMLTQTGASVMTAESAAAGMTIFQQFQPDALICDIAMPIEDGYAFIRRIRTLSAANGGNTPALALTAMAGEGNQRRALSEGFQMYLVKPVDMKHLADTMAAVLEGGTAVVLQPQARGARAKGSS